MAASPTTLRLGPFWEVEIRYVAPPPGAAMSTYPTARMARQDPVIPDPVPLKPGHDTMCERGRGTVSEECHCHSRTYVLDREAIEPTDTPWGLFAFQRDQPDTRGHETRRPWTPEGGPS